MTEYEMKLLEALERLIQAIQKMDKENTKQMESIVGFLSDIERNTLT